ncbi:uncharacterized protein SPAPADRAFT_48031 [Spathaspora passalidarum NRRL Y-27907]|uniref:Uncharacterized protein n=1 Tax=Spathaspora passalidarum (strain NRRL Y-27907 / 11-Y1) TaxID=619300 RepID=G3AFI3_SPAPN|nr:uncharacterized protein SPAPADRAFT_48031 [Spathaspora passalidarum NRRL Y-27907]EGW34972.1 hypothetical protein SPAPADRAFT_48031 [Spathaspora passalidarum NRRL Y-27907]
MFKIRYSHLAKRRMRIAPIFHNTGLIQSRSIRLSAEGVRVAKNYRYIMSVLAGVYVGVGIVSLGSFYFMYHDADTRQPIPFELSFQNQVTAVKAINKDDALKSPRYAVKHYRRLLIELAKEVDPSVDENSLGPFEVPIIDSDTLVHKKSNKFSNFYIDIVLRYAKALLAKGQLEVSMDVLSKIINDDVLFYKLGDTEKLAAGSRLLAKVSPDPEQKQYYLKRAINMLRKFYPSIIVDQDYVLAENSNISDEILNCLNDLAFQYASASKSTKNKKQKEELLSNSLKIYLANLRCLNIIREGLETQTKTQVNFPWFNCDRENLIISICELRAHISEVMWAKGFKKNAIGWSEEVVEEIYYDRQSSAKASPLLINVLNNLVAMYDDIKDTASKNRCEKLRSELKVFDFEVSTKWYDDLIKKWSKIMYKDGPIEILAKPLRERFGFGERVLDIEEYEDEDVE